jgi:flap endonuclease-1
VVQAPNEGEAQASHLGRTGKVDYVGSQDYDCLLYGAPKMIRNVNITGKRKLPRRNQTVMVEPEIIDLEQVLKENEIDLKQLRAMSFLIGTDYNPKGVKGVAPPTALKLIKKHGRLTAALEAKNVEVDPEWMERWWEQFEAPKVEDSTYEFGEIDREAVFAFLVDEHDFGRQRIEDALNKYDKEQKDRKGSESQTSLDSWF